MGFFSLLSTLSGASIPIAILLGLIQGLTEFLPVSSSGHLVIGQVLFGAPQPGILLEIILHAGTLLAVLVVYRRDLWQILCNAGAALRALPREGWGGLARARELWLLGLASVPAVLAGVAFRGPVETAFENPRAAAGFLMVTGMILLATRWMQRRDRGLGAGAGLLMGIGQAFSLLPGISRSGSTISAGMLARVEPAKVVRFSFLMSVPAIFGSLIFSLPDLAGSLQVGTLPAYGAGFLVAFLSGIAAIRILLRVVARGRFFLFGIYCLIAGLLSWLYLG